LKGKEGVEIVGYVVEIKVGGTESTNCPARAAEQRDTHMELPLDPMSAAPSRRVIVEVNAALAD